MIRRCVEKPLLVLLIIIEKRSQNITADAITMPKSDCRRPKERQMPEISGRARHCCARHRFGEQGTARPTCAAWRCRGGCVNRLNFVGRLCQTPTIRARRFRTEPRDASDLDGQAGGRASGSERVKRPTIYFGLTALCDP